MDSKAGSPKVVPGLGELNCHGSPLSTSRLFFKKNLKLSKDLEKGC